MSEVIRAAFHRRFEAVKNGVGQPSQHGLLAYGSHRFDATHDGGASGAVATPVGGPVGVNE